MSISIKEKALQGLELYRAGKYDEAELILKEAADCGEINGIYGMGLICLHKCKEKDGIRFLEKAISMNSGLTSTLAKLTCGEYYCSKGDFENCYIAVCYYESVLDEGKYPDMQQNAAESLKKIREQMRAIFKEDDSYFDDMAIKAIEYINNNQRSTALKFLKMCVLMGAENSWLGMGLYFFTEDSDKSLEFLERYIKRSKEKTFIEEVYTLSAEIYEEKGDALKDSNSSVAQVMYVKAIRSMQSAISCTDDNDSLREFKEIHSRLIKKQALLNVAEMERQEKANNDLLGDIDEIERTALAGIVCIDDEEEKPSVQKKATPVPSEKQPDNDNNYMNFKTIAEYVSTFADRFQTKDSFCFPCGMRFKNDKSYQRKMLKKMWNAIEKFAPDISIDDILVYHDLTVFGSGKDGFIITENYFYYRSVGTKFRVRYDEFESLSFVPKKGNKRLEFDYSLNMKVKCEKYGRCLFGSDSSELVKSLYEMLDGCIRISNKRNRQK